MRQSGLYQQSKAFSVAIGSETVSLFRDVIDDIYRRSYGRETSYYLLFDLSSTLAYSVRENDAAQLPKMRLIELDDL